MRQSFFLALVCVWTFATMAGLGLAVEAIAESPDPETVRIGQRAAYVKLCALGVTCNTAKRI